MYVSEACVLTWCRVDTECVVIITPREAVRHLSWNTLGKLCVYTYHQTVLFWSFYQVDCVRLVGEPQVTRMLYVTYGNLHNTYNIIYTTVLTRHMNNLCG